MKTGPETDKELDITPEIDGGGDGRSGEENTSTNRGTNALSEDDKLHPSENEPLDNREEDDVPSSVADAFVKLSLQEAGEEEVVKKKDQKLEEDEELAKAPPSLRALASWIQEGKCRRILVLSGAGVSVAAGIPDFRTPGTGLYDNLQQYDLPFPEAVFDLDFYRQNPKPFCNLAREMWPGLKHTPTLTHSFVALLADKNLLLRNYSQNIDGLEYLAETPADLLLECHGHYRTATCIECHKSADPVAVRQTIVVDGKAPKCDKCNGLVKPDIVFFGESLPFKFQILLNEDKKKADLVLVLGTSLQVAPVSSIPDMVSGSCKRVLINRDLVGSFSKTCRYSTSQTGDKATKAAKHRRDLFVPGDCDDSIRLLAKLLGWHEDLEEKHERAAASIRKEQVRN
jgi:NAD-dependent SIR2 family protein deacetylase